MMALVGGRQKTDGQTGDRRTPYYVSHDNYDYGAMQLPRKDFNLGGGGWGDGVGVTSYI